MIEVELKCEITPTAWPRIEQRLAQMQRVRQVCNSDHYYDTVDFRLLSQAVFVRIRNQTHLDCKYNELAETAHTHCREYTFSVVPPQEHVPQMNALFSRFLPGWRDAKTVQEAIAHNGLVELAHIENRRTQYAQEDLIVCVDRVEGLGDFLEMELQCREEQETHAALVRLEHMVADLALKPIRVGYVERWLQKHHPHAYRKGKYREEPQSSVEAG